MFENAIEVGVNESYANPRIRSRMKEVGISECRYGCKYYQDPVSEMTVLQHSSSYGCKRTKIDIQGEADPFSGTNYWMVSIGDRLSEKEKERIKVRAGFNSVNKSIRGIGEGLSEMGKRVSAMLNRLNGTMSVAEAREAVGPPKKALAE